MVGQQQVVDAAAAAAAATTRVPVPPPKPLLRTIGGNLMETFFPDDPFRAVARESGGRRALAALRYVFPFLEWLPSYSLAALWSDVVAGVTIASLAVPQGISYAKLGDLPPIMGLCKSSPPPPSNLLHACHC
jgi:sulfate transporter 3